MSKYGGESPAKKVARLNWWKSMIEIMPSTLSSRIMVLAGPTAGDARVLRALGCDMSRVTMVDIDADAIESAASIVPEALAFKGTDAEAAFAMRGKYDVVALDYCCQVNTENVRKFGRVASVALRSTGGIAACGMSYGREGSAAYKVVDRAKEYVTQTLWYKNEIAGLSASERARHVNRAARLVAFRDAGKRAFASVGLRFEERGVSFYKSFTDTKAGTPMMYTIGTAKRGRGEYRDPMSRALKRSTAALSSIIIQHGKYAEWKDDANVMSVLCSTLVDNGMGIDTENPDDLREAAVSVARIHGSATAAELLALSPDEARSVPAWLAVDTRARRTAA